VKVDVIDRRAFVRQLRCVVVVDLMGTRIEQIENIELFVEAVRQIVTDPRIDRYGRAAATLPSSSNGRGPKYR